MNNELKKMILASLFVALGIVLPFLTGGSQELGNMFSLMHIPILLAGFILDYKYGFIVGLLTPILRSVLIGSPPLMPIALSMMFELATYGLITGVMYKILPKKDINILFSLAIAMIIGRIVWGAAATIFYGIAGWEFTFKTFITAGFITAAPGIAIQLVLIPLLYTRLKETGLLEKINAS